MPVIGYLGSSSPDRNVPTLAAFRQGLSEIGYVEGQNLAIEYRWAQGHYDRLPALAADLVGRNVDVIVTNGGTPPALAAKNATPSIPIVFSPVGDAVRIGLVASLARPGGNLTGFSFLNAEQMLSQPVRVSRYSPVESVKPGRFPPFPFLKAYLIRSLRHVCGGNASV